MRDSYYGVAQGLKVMMEYHGLEKATEEWSKKYPGLEIDDLLDQGVEADRGGEFIWFNYDAFCDEDKLLNIVLEHNIDMDYYRVILTDRSGDEIESMVIEWDETIQVVLDKLNS